MIGCFRRGLIPALAAILIFVPEPGHAVAIQSGSSPNLQISGVLQPRLDAHRFESAVGYRFRRARVTVRSSLLDDRVRTLVTPEFSGASVALRDAWIDLGLTGRTTLRTGQWSPPFNWQREVSSARQHFSERGRPSSEFGTPQGRDRGVALLTHDPANRWRASVGVFDGAGMARGEARPAETRSPGGLTRGALMSGRASMSLSGPLPTSESHLAPNLASNVDGSQDVEVAVGTGVQAAWKSGTRSWDLGRSASGLVEADWQAATVDVVTRWRGWSMVAEGYGRRVEPADPEVETYRGFAGLLGMGTFVWRQHLEVVGRLGIVQADRMDPATRRTTRELGVNAFLEGHTMKIQAHYIETRGPDGGLAAQPLPAFALQLQILF